MKITKPTTAAVKIELRRKTPAPAKPERDSLREYGESTNGVPVVNIRAKSQPANLLVASELDARKVYLVWCYSRDSFGTNLYAVRGEDIVRNSQHLFDIGAVVRTRSGLVPAGFSLCEIKDGAFAALKEYGGRVLFKRRVLRLHPRVNRA